ncbi:discoidin domain-containing protein [Novosphingobium sp. KCTC 2891]|uniref:MGH1-like glycoside hydrolase domain-containing protein n=1 Tax=Novosphingobium sp. KCTC 2891 TaxID=2989730 RepID=UPI002221ED58|nr:discoidin domain-containing protein [Novosphingobium sp. KCTC 2891]MCW1381628.1 discoidin domain-containing protein [Novosphingobium sp. KCTC 2891]
MRRAGIRIARSIAGKSLAALLCLAPPALAAPRPAAGLDTHRIAQDRFGNDAPWYEGRIPFFESADPRIDAVYYYRWQLFRAHQRDLGAEGFISTEFLDDVGWQREPYASLNDATGFHVGEGRWLNDRRFADDYISFMYAGGNDRHFTDYMADAVWGRYLVDGDRDAVVRHLPVMRHIYRLWDEKFDFSKGLYFVEPLLDATEYTVSSIDASGGRDGFRGGDAFRPSINSYMFANARALSRIAALAGDEASAAEYAARAEALRGRVLADLWNPALGHFTDRHQAENEHVRYWQPIRARELVGYVPWMFDLVPEDARFAAAWAHLLDPAMLGGKAGMRTVEAGYEYYLKQYRYLGDAPECQWNGPVWPYQTTQVLIAMANLLDHHGATGPITRSDYLRLLRQYAALHRQGDGRLDLEEDYHPETGKPIVGLTRSHHYFHSGFVDLVLGGLVGIRPRADDVLEVNPLLPPQGDPQALAWFRVQDVPYHGHRVGVTWDADGLHYRRGAGLSVEIDGREVARRADLGRVTIPLARAPLPVIQRPIDLSVQLVRGAFPRGEASSNADPEAVHDAIDGRVWFFPELPNGWTSAPGPVPQWYAIDFGREVDLGRAELAFFADGRRFAVPRGYRIEAWQGDAWRTLPAALGAPLANGVTEAHWPAVRASKVRVAMDLAPGRAVRLVEFKLFAR